MMSPRLSLASPFLVFQTFALYAAGFCLAGSLSQGMAEVSNEMPKEVVAAQIRSQGFACDKPQNATKDATLSRPDEAVWILTCENATYRVRLIPDMAAKIEQLQERK